MAVQILIRDGISEGSQDEISDMQAACQCINLMWEYIQEKNEKGTEEIYIAITDTDDYLDPASFGGENVPSSIEEWAQSDHASIQKEFSIGSSRYAIMTDDAYTDTLILVKKE